MMLLVLFFTSSSWFVITFGSEEISGWKGEEGKGNEEEGEEEKSSTGSFSKTGM